jgi:hypothetical protein
MWLCPNCPLFKPVEQSRQKVLRAYCLNLYTVTSTQYGVKFSNLNARQKEFKWFSAEKQFLQKKP